MSFCCWLAAIPLQSIAFLFGGVSETEVILSFVILLVTSIALGSIGIYFSCVMQRTLAASIATYGFALIITIGLPLLMIVLASLLIPFVLAISPGLRVSLPLQIGLTYVFGVVICTNPLATAFASQWLILNSKGTGLFTWSVSTPAVAPATVGTMATIPLISPWIVFTVFYLVVAVIMVILSIRRVRKIED